MSSEASTLSFAQLRKANVERCESQWHGVDEWSPTDWACAMAGECGEACNLIKKLRRGDAPATIDIARELADLIIYADLLAARLDIDLGEAVREKFNLKSRESDCPILLTRGCTTRAKCCDRAGQYNGFGSDGPLLFTCPKSCPCHD